MLERSVKLSDSEADFDRFSAVHSPRLIVARVDSGSKDEEEGMDLKQRTGLGGQWPTGIRGQLRKKSLRPKFLLLSL